MTPPNQPSTEDGFGYSTRDHGAIDDGLDNLIAKYLPNKKWEELRNIEITKDGSLRLKKGSNYSEYENFKSALTAYCNRLADERAVSELELMDKKFVLPGWISRYIEDRKIELANSAPDRKG